MTIFEINIFGINIAPTYYWLMYALSFIIWYYILKHRKIFSSEKLDSLLMYIFAGVIFGGRFGYVIFYNLPFYIENPSKILHFWEWGMSFHGWVIWVILAMFIFSKVHKMSFLKTADNITSILPIWLGLWRIGNYINKELLWFYPYNWPLWVEKEGNIHFPSPLLESLLEWLVLYVILSIIYKKSKIPWVVSASFLLFYGLFRLFIELFRIPDEQLGYLFWGLTMGQILSLPMIIFWITFIIYKYYVSNKTIQ